MYPEISIITRRSIGAAATRELIAGKAEHVHAGVHNVAEERGKKAKPAAQITITLDVI